MSQSKQELAFSIYCDESIRLDQYRAVASSLITRILPYVDAAAQKIPDLAALNAYLADDSVDRQLREFIHAAALGATTFKRTFSTENSYYRTLYDDNTFFSLRIFLAFQWSLFEEFVRDSLDLLIEQGAMPPGVISRIESFRGTMAPILKMMDNKQIFPESPFRDYLPYPSRVEIGFNDLDAIRRHRNNFVHWNEEAKRTFSNPEAYYERCMWVLRQFASKIHNEVKRMLAKCSQAATTAEQGAGGNSAG